MSHFNDVATREQDQHEAGKIRGRIPRSDWAYVLGQSKLVGRTLESIGNEYGAKPSAIHYVVKQAGLLAADGKLEPTLEKPATQEASAAMHEAISKARRSSQWSAKRIEDVVKAPSQVELMAQQANAMLEDETCKRLFDATSKTIVDYVAFKAGPADSAKKEFKDALHELRRAIASIELKVEMTPAAKPVLESGTLNNVSSPTQAANSGQFLKLA